MLTRSSSVFTRPTNSSISLGLLPAAATRVGCAINVGIGWRSNFLRGRWDGKRFDANEPERGSQVAERFPRDVRRPPPAAFESGVMR